MSAYKCIECDFVDRDALIEALKELGLDPVIHETPQALRGYMGDKRNSLAQIVVDRTQLNKSFTGASNDLGFNWNAKTKQWDMVCSEYDARAEVHQRVSQSYAKIMIEKALSKERFKIKESTPSESLRQRQRTAVRIVGRKVV